MLGKLNSQSSVTPMSQIDDDEKEQQKCKQQCLMITFGVRILISKPTETLFCMDEQKMDLVYPYPGNEVTEDPAGIKYNFTCKAPYRSHTERQNRYNASILSVSRWSYRNSRASSYLPTSIEFAYTVVQLKNQAYMCNYTAA